MSNIQKFHFQNFPFNVVELNGEPWFIAKEVCKILEHTNHKVAIQSLDADEVRKVYLIDNLGREQEKNIINESGLYTLILRSNKPNAKIFRKWVTNEILPSIRKTGIYSINSSSLIEQNTILMKIISLQEQVINLTKELETAQNQPKYRLVTEAEKSEIISLFHLGMPKKAIARKLGRHPKTIRYHLKGVSHE